MIQKTCKICKVTYEGQEVEAFFIQWRKNSYNICYRNFSPICNGCKLTERTEKKQRNRPLEKARRTLISHADKYIKRGFASSVKEFAQKFRWDIYQMGHDIEHAAANGCPYCRQFFSEMAHGLRDVTLDIINPEQDPYYGINTRWCCATCNNEKGRTPPNLWGAKLRAWDKWREHQLRLEIDPWAGLPLFEGLS